MRFLLTVLRCIILTAIDHIEFLLIAVWRQAGILLPSVHPSAAATICSDHRISQFLNDIRKIAYAKGGECREYITQTGKYGHLFTKNFIFSIKAPFQI